MMEKLDGLLSLHDYYRLIRQSPADIVHVHYAAGWEMGLVLLANRYPLVVTVMGGDVLFNEQWNPPSMRRWLTRELLREADLVTSKSDYLSCVLRQLGVRDEKIMRVFWGVDLQRFHRVPTEALRENLGLSPQDRVILSPRILRRFYNIHLIIEVMPRILKSYPNAKLLVTEYNPDQTYKADLVKRVRHLKLEEHVLFVGEIDHAEMPMYYSISDVAVGIPPSDGLP